MPKNDDAHRASHHQRASASVTAALAGLPYPIATDEAAQRVGDWQVPFGRGETVPLARLLEGLPERRLEDPGAAMRAVDRHWTRMADALRAAPKSREPASQDQ